METLRRTVYCVLLIVMVDSVLGFSPWESINLQRQHKARSLHLRHANRSFHRILTISPSDEQSWTFGELFSTAKDSSTKILLLPCEARTSETEETITTWNDLTLYNRGVRDFAGLRAASYGIWTLTCEVQVKSLLDFCHAANLVIKTLDSLENHATVTATDSLCTQDLSITKFSYTVVDGIVVTLITENPALLDEDSLNLTCRKTSGCSQLYPDIKGEMVLATPFCGHRSSTTSSKPSMLRWVITSDDYECNLSDEQGQPLGIEYVCENIGDAMVGGALDGLESLCKARQAGTYSSPYATLEGKIAGQMVIVNKNDMALDLTLVCLS